jgi:hypothetical protein
VAYLIDAATGDQLHKFTVSNGGTWSQFGYSVAMDGDKALIGAWADDDDGTSSGSAYLFDTTSGNQLQKFTASDGATNDQFGRSVALSGDTLLMGARNDDDDGSASASTGAAYLYTAQTTPPPTNVPTSSTLALMLAAGLGLVVSGRRFSGGARGPRA